MLKNISSVSRMLIISVAGAALSLSACTKEEYAPGMTGGFNFTTVAEDFSGQDADKEATKSNVTYTKIGEIDGKELYFVCEEEPMAVPEDVATKTTVTTAVTGTFKVSGYSYQGDWDPEVCCPNLMYNVTTSVYSGATQSVGNYYWPGEDYKVRFYATWPLSNGASIVSTATTPGPPQVSFTATNSSGSNTDIFEGWSQEYDGDACENVKITFRHMLSGLRLKTGNVGYSGKITTVVVSGVNMTGKHIIGSDEWTDFSNVGSYSISPNKDITGEADVDLINGASTMLVIPQTLPEGAKITITFSGINFSADLEGQEWKPGVMYTYRFAFLNTQVERFIDTADGKNLVTQTGLGEASGSFTVYSKKRHLSGLEKNVTWKMEFSEDGGETWFEQTPSYLSVSATTGNGAANSITIKALARSYVYESCNIGENAPVGSVDAPVDLSKKNVFGEDIEMSTANCYMVHAPGYYMIPLVYGNAVKDGAEYTRAYNNGSAVSNGLQVLRNAYDANITSANVVTDVTASSKAVDMSSGGKLLWTTCENSITVDPVLKTGDNGYTYLCFSIPENVTDNFNAVIGVKDTGGNFVWSWHIWAIRDTPVSENVQTYKFLNVPLGGLPLLETVSSGTTKVKIYQEEYKDACWIIDVVREKLSVMMCYSATYYQWGRKDPMLPSSGIGSNTNSPQFGDFQWSAGGTSAVTVGNSIKNPNLFIKAQKWCSISTDYNFWDMDNGATSSDSPVLKTIYDPCPVGFTIPRYSAFVSWNSSSIYGSFDRGYRIKRYDGDTVGSYIGAYGYRDYSSSSVSSSGSYGCFWLSVPYDSISGRNLFFHSGNINPQDSNYRGGGCCVRPQSE